MLISDISMGKNSFWQDNEAATTLVKYSETASSVMAHPLIRS